jgi:hypothetical protein
LSDDALVVDLYLPPGSVRAIAGEGFGAIETLCTSAAASDQAYPCAERRANVLRLKARAWAGGLRAEAVLSFRGEPPKVLAASVTTRVDDGRVSRSQQQVAVGNGQQP